MQIQTLTKTYLQTIRIVNYLAILAVAFTAAFPSRVFATAWTVWLVTWGLEGRFLRKKNFSWSRLKIPVLLLALFYVWQAVSLLWAPDTQVGLKLLETQMSFVAIVPIALFGVNKYYKTNSILSSLVLGTLTAILAYAMSLIYLNNVEYFLNTGKKEFWKTINMEDFEIWFVYMKHRLYFCTILVIALFSLPFLYQKFSAQYGKHLTISILFLVALILLAALYLSGSRSMILALLLITGLALLRFVDKKYRYWVGASVTVLVALGLYLFISFHPRMKNFESEDFEALQTGKTENLYIEPRLLIWHTVFENPEDYLAYGLGAGNSTEYLVEKYKINEFPEVFTNNRFGGHNQYFIEMMELGLAGALFIVLFFILFHQFYSGNTRRFAFYFGLLYAFNLLTEGMLGRSDGVITLSLFTLICLWMQNEQDSKSQERRLLKL